MFKHILVLSFSLLAATFSSVNANTCDDQYGAVEFTVGWRKDDLKWKNNNLYQSHLYARGKSHINFSEIESYNFNLKARFSGECYYFRASADFGLTVRGKAHESFNMRSPFLYNSNLSAHTHDGIKRDSKLYDFDAAAGYPFTFLCGDLTVIPMIGFSFHRQELRLRMPHSSYYSSSSYYSYSSSPSFEVSSFYPLAYYFYSDPFDESSSSDDLIASKLGLSARSNTCKYDFSWYGVYLGVDLAYILDEFWTLFGEFEGHFLDKCYQRRRSHTGVHFLDHFHKTTNAYGFDGLVGLIYSFDTCWYATLTAEYNWWKTDKKHDQLTWKMGGVKLGVGYTF